MLNIKTSSAHILRDVLEKASRVEVLAGGVSMYPTIKKDTTLVVEKLLNKPNKGDIILREDSGRVIAHRVISTKNGVITRGDNCKNIDAETSTKSIIGKIVVVKSNKKGKDITHFTFQLVRFFILHFSSITRLYIKILFSVRKGKLKVLEIRKNILLLTREHKQQSNLGIILSTILGIIPLAILFVVKILIDALYLGDKMQSMWMFSIVIALFGLQLLLQPLYAFLKEKLSQSIQYKSHILLQKQCNAIPFEYFENSQNQDELFRATVEASGRPVRMLNAYMSFMQTLVAGLFIISWLAWQNIFLLGTLCLFLFPWFIFKIRNAKQLYSFYKKYNQKEREYYYFHRVLTSVAFLKELKIFNSFSFFSNKYKQAYSTYYTSKNSLLKKHLLIELGLLFFLIVALVYVFYILINKSLNGTVSVGTLVLIILLFQRGFSVIKTLFQSVATIIDNQSYLSDFISFIQKKTEELGQTQGIHLNNQIRLQNVNFSYPSSFRNALSNVTFEIKKNKTIALVGENGSGKTTLVKLLCGLHTPTQGKILFDDLELSSENLQIIRNSVTAVFQDYALYNIPVSENISFEKTADIHEIIHAGKQSGIHESISNLPNSYNTMLGNYFEKGEQLSIGEWQKIAISRAFYRNKDILIFDEPTSALDSKTESQLIETFKQLAEDKTCIIVSHRLSTIEWVDEIIVMHQGKIVEKGTHAQLIESKGYYYNMFNNKN